MDARLQRRVQRYGWNLAVSDYEAGWTHQLQPLHNRLLSLLAASPGEKVLDIACGPGQLSLHMAESVGPGGEVVGIDLSERMVERAWDMASLKQPSVDAAAPVRFLHMDAETLSFPAGNFNAVLCALGLMYVPDPVKALHEMRRVLAPGGRVVLGVWAGRASCGWSALFDIVADEVTTDVCPLFFQMGDRAVLEFRCTHAGFERITTESLAVTLDYADAEEACRAAFAGGPAALAWSRFDASTRARVQRRYLDTIQPWRDGRAYRIPGEFLILNAVAGAQPGLYPPNNHNPLFQLF
jgi:ubiquinone/menaquinone biosynthesis C-methylase UbiE